MALYTERQVEMKRGKHGSVGMIQVCSTTQSTHCPFSYQC